MSPELRCEVDLESGDVRRGGRLERLPPRLLSLLRYLIEHPREVISRDQLIASVWGHLEAASDDSVNVAVSDLRRTLGDTGRPHRVIETVPRRGYRYLGHGVVSADLSAALQTEPARETAKNGGDTIDSPTLEPPVSARTDAIVGTTPAPTRWRLFGGLLAAVLGIALAAWLWPSAKDVSPAPPSRSVPPAVPNPSVAVLPFLDLSAAGDQRYFADALVDRIIHMLAQVRGLEVAARTSAFAFRDGKATVDEIGKTLRVGAVLEGSLMREGERLRVIAQLIDVDSGMHLWSKSYDREEGELFALQDEIANEVSRTLTDTLLPERALQQPRSRAAYDLTARAHFATDEGTLAGAQAARQFFLQALEHDPDYVPALVGLFEIGGLIVGHRGETSAADLEQSLTALERAKRLDPDAPDVLRALGMNQRRLGQHTEALALFARAIDGNPNDAGAWVGQGDLQLYLGDFDAALASLRRAQRIDPLSSRIARRLADAYWSVGRAEEALAQLREILRRDPDNAPAHGAMSSYLLRLGRSGEAMRFLQAQRRLDPDSPLRRARECEMFLQLGDDAGAEQCTDDLQRSGGSRLHVLYLRQALHAFRGEWEARLGLMDELLELASPNDRLMTSVLADAYARFSCPRALEILTERAAELFNDPPKLSPALSTSSTVAVRCLRREGREAEAERLLAAFAAMVERLRLPQGPELVTGMEGAWVLALQGDDEAALEALEALVDGGWRYNWWQLDAYPEFARIAERDAFAQLVRRLEAGVREQREYYLQRRGDLLPPPR